MLVMTEGCPSRLCHLKRTVLSATKQWLNTSWSKWESLALTLADDYVRMWQVEYTSLASAEQPYIILDFDELIKKERRQSELQTVLNFLGDGFNSARVQCAFDAKTSTGAQRPKVAENDELATIDDALTPLLVCKLWEIISKAEVAARELRFNWDYRPFGNIKC